MKVREWLKEYWFQVHHSPNSPEGLRHRAEKVEHEYGRNNAYVRALFKQAELLEAQKRKQ